MTSQTDDLSSLGRADSLQDAAWQSQVARPWLIALQATCLAMGPWLIALSIGAHPALRWAPLPIFVAALLGTCSAQWLAQPAQRLTGKTAFLLAEFLVMLALLRLLTWAWSGQWPTLATVRDWVLEPWTFFDGLFVAVSLCCALAWHRAGVVATIFYWLALTPGELAYDAERRAGSLWRLGRMPERAYVSRAELVEQYTSQWLLGGIFLAFCAAVTRVRIGPGWSLNVFSMGVAPQIVVASVLYFLIGLVLISQARLAVLRAQWLQDGVEMPEHLPDRWSRFSLLIIVGVGLLAALLPLGSTWQIGAILDAVVMAIVQAALWVVFLVTTLFALLLRAFGQDAPLPEMPQETAPATMMPSMPWLALPPWVGGASLWLAVVVALLLSLRFLLGESGLGVTKEKLLRALAALLASFKARWQGLRRLARSVQVSLPGYRSRATREPTLAPPWRFVRLGALPPREQVRYFYLSTLRRAADHGVARQPAQTPLEFVHDLESTWPETEVDVEALTEAFVLARYDVAEISSDKARAVKSIWERIKRALRGRRNAAPGGSDGLR